MVEFLLRTAGNSFKKSFQASRGKVPVVSANQCFLKHLSAKPLLLIREKPPYASTFIFIGSEAQFLISHYSRNPKETVSQIHFEISDPYMHIRLKGEEENSIIG